MQREYRHLFPPLQALIITQTNHPPGDFFFCQKRQIQRLLLVFLETFVVFGDSKARITLQLGLLCSTSSGCCREPLSRPKALTGGQSLSSLAQQSEQRGDTHPSRFICSVQAANESRMRMAAAVPALAYRAGCKCKCKCSLTLTQK